ncbi:long-chain-fatty-acid--CoA ligase [Hazenella coriacea]|uniref:O-succinylbenzoate-CoA ligase n=1 Tax=Hazenella coriacea TaxID=1179467 RepID=A0A4R3L4I1_9BACL|nr:long-chain-fatty-acid--CoA ligase [Hazenella coriacea]TCS93640.1 O-succinylbenzoate-CoA ligase [Hazenella coriacea]
MATIDKLLKHRAHFSPNLEALVSGNKRYTYEEYLKRVNQLAHYLLEQNVQKGDRVALLCKNNHHFPTILMAILHIGAVAVPISWKLSADEMKFITNNCQPKILFYDEEFAPLLSSVKDSSILPTLVLAGDDTDTTSSFEELLAGRMTKNPYHISIEKEDPAVIIYTSGTTGMPKGVVITHENICSAIPGTSMAVEFNFEDRYLAASPLFHVSGLIAMICSIQQGMTMIFMTDFDPVQIWDLIEAEKVTTMMSVPPMLFYMHPEFKNKEREISHLKSFICGGIKVPETLIRQYDDLGISITQVYGCTEAAGAISCWTTKMGMDQCMSVGKVALGLDVKIVDPETRQEVPLENVGEIAIKGAQIFREYWAHPEATQQVFEEGWFFTGDAGKIDESGFLYVLDRYKDLIINGGENIYPAQVEEVIIEMNEVQEVALIGIPDEIYGEIPRAYIVKKPNHHLKSEDILSHCKRKIANYKLTEIVFVDELPKSSFGKVMKSVLREQAIKELQIQ